MSDRDLILDSYNQVRQTLISSLAEKGYRVFDPEDVDNDGLYTCIIINEKNAYCIEYYKESNTLTVEIIFPERERRSKPFQPALKFLKEHGVLEMKDPDKLQYQSLVTKYGLQFETYAEYPQTNALIEYIIKLNADQNKLPVNYG